MTLVQRGHLPPPEPGAPGILAMGDPGRVRELVIAAGFREPTLDEIAFDFRYADFDDLWDALVRLAGPLGRAVSALPDDERQATRDAIERNVEPDRVRTARTAPRRSPGVCTFAEQVGHTAGCVRHYMPDFRYACAASAPDVGVRSCHSVAGHWSSTCEYGARDDGELSVIFQYPAGTSAAYPGAWRSIFGASAKGRLRS